MKTFAHQINESIAIAGCYMQQDAGLIDHIVEHVDKVRAKDPKSPLNQAADLISQLSKEIQALKDRLAKHEPKTTDGDAEPSDETQTPADPKAETAVLKKSAAKFKVKK